MSQYKCQAKNKKLSPALQELLKSNLLDLIKTSLLFSMGKINVKGFLSWKTLWDFCKWISDNSTGKREEWMVKNPLHFVRFEINSALLLRQSLFRTKYSRMDQVKFVKGSLLVYSWIKYLFRKCVYLSQLFRKCFLV